MRVMQMRTQLANPDRIRRVGIGLDDARQAAQAGAVEPQCRLAIAQQAQAVVQQQEGQLVATAGLAGLVRQVQQLDQWITRAVQCRRHLHGDPMRSARHRSAIVPRGCKRAWRSCSLKLGRAARRSGGATWLCGADVRPAGPGFVSSAGTGVSSTWINSFVVVIWPLLLRTVSTTSITPCTEAGTRPTSLPVAGSNCSQDGKGWPSARRASSATSPSGSDSVNDECGTSTLSSDPPPM